MLLMLLEIYTEQQVAKSANFPEQSSWAKEKFVLFKADLIKILLYGWSFGEGAGDVEFVKYF